MTVEETLKRYADDITLQELVRLRVENEQLKEVALFLYAVLDDIDTVDDIAKADEAYYRESVRKLHKKRFEVAETDGHTVTFKKVNKNV